jgi:hypothetical protein
VVNIVVRMSSNVRVSNPFPALRESRLLSSSFQPVTGAIYSFAAPCLIYSISRSSRCCARWDEIRVSASWSSAPGPASCQALVPFNAFFDFFLVMETEIGRLVWTTWTLTNGTGGGGIFMRQAEL